MWQLRTHADAWLVDRHRIAVVGASAGGHLAGMLDCTRMGSRCAGGQPLIVQTPAGVDPHDTLYLLQQRYDAFIAFLAQTIASPQLPGNQ